MEDIRLVLFGVLIDLSTGGILELFFVVKEFDNVAENDFILVLGLG